MTTRFTRTLSLALFGLIALGSLISCSKELTHKAALSEIASLPDFQKPYYAPMRIGEVVLTGANHQDTEAYIRTNYGILIGAELLTVREIERNSWRSVIDIQLTQRGLERSDPQRGNQKEAYVEVCRMVPIRVDSLRVLSQGQIIECDYTFAEQEITPFGVFRGFEQGREYKDTRTFVRARGSWRVK